MRASSTLMPFTMRVKRASMWSSARKLSGTITRSTDECEMSRSCHSATFSSEASAFAAHQPGEARDLLAAHRVALVRHRRGALLPRAEGLLDLAHLGLLQRADLGRELLEARRDERERRHHLGVAVALEDLRGDGRRQQPELRADRLLDLGRQVRERPHGARELAVGDRGPGAVEPRELALQLRVPQRELQAERHRLGVHAVRAPDHRRRACGGRRARERRPSGPRGPPARRSIASRIRIESAVSTTSDEVRP